MKDVLEVMSRVDPLCSTLIGTIEVIENEICNNEEFYIDF